MQNLICLPYAQPAIPMSIEAASRWCENVAVTSIPGCIAKCSRLEVQRYRALQAEIPLRAVRTKITTREPYCLTRECDPAHCSEFHSAVAFVVAS